MKYLLSLNSVVVPVVIVTKTNEIFILFEDLAKTDNDSSKKTYKLQSLLFDVDSSASVEYLFGAFYYSYKGYGKTTYEFRIGEKDHNCNIRETDVVCSFLCAHPKKENFFYIMRMDWKEYTLHWDYNASCLHTKCVYPTSAEILNKRAAFHNVSNIEHMNNVNIVRVEDLLHNYRST